MATEVVMPQMGESIAEGTITKWLVKVGDTVERDQPLFEISTDKVDAEIPSPTAGTLLEIKHQEGDTVEVDAVVAVIGAAGEDTGEKAQEGEAKGEKADEEREDEGDAEAEDPEKAEEEPGTEEEPGAEEEPGVEEETGVEEAEPVAGDEGEYDFDLVILGSGPGGYVAAIRAGQLGLEVACVEKDSRYGGTCLLRGCIPTKALLYSAELMDKLRHSSEFGIKTSEVSLDISKVYAHKSNVVDQNARGVEFLFKKNDVQGIQGRGKLVGHHEIDVEQDGETRRITARNILLATGSVPREIAIARTDGEKIVNSDHVLETERMPSSVIVVGAGAVGTEFASIYRSFGAEVDLVEMLPRLLPAEDEEVSKQLDRSFKKRGINTYTEAKMTQVETTDTGVKISIEHKGKEKSLEAEMLLVAIGRAPVTDGIGYEEQGIEMEKGYVTVDEMMRTSVPNVYAIGDIVHGVPWLAHVASAMGIVAVEHMAGHETRALDYDRVPQVTFCDPEVASVGLTEAEAKKRGYEVQVGKFPLSASGKAKIIKKTDGFVKIVRDTKYDEVLGIHIIGPHATDLIGEACAALQLEATAEELFRAIHPHPTLTEAIMEAAHASHGSAIHF